MKKGLMTTILALVVVLVTGCVGVPSLVSTPAGEEVNFRLWISDEANAIGDFDELMVTISGVGMVQADGNGLIKESCDLEVDLTTLVGDNATEVWEGTIPNGEYTKVFLYVAKVTGTLNGDEPVEADVKLPSNKLQISKPFTISSESGQVVDFVFDITVIKAGKYSKYILKPQIAQSGADQNIDDVTPEDLGITTTSPLPDGVVGEEYEAEVEAAEGIEPYTWSIVSDGGDLPDGLDLDGDTGVISGNPTTAGEYEFTVHVKDESDPVQSDTQKFSISIAAAELIITEASLPDGVVGEAYTATAVEATGGTGPYEWTISEGDLPDGLELGPDDGKISGTPEAGSEGDYTFTVQVKDDSAQTDTQDFSIHIDA